MRCKCCDKILNDDELITRNPVTCDFEDMCYACLTISMDAYADIEPDEDIH